MKKERNTEQKEILTKYLKDNSNKHLSIGKIQKDLKDSIGLTTIYRIINGLVEKGVVSKIALENSQGFCYQYNEKVEECTDHYHLICEKCNKTIHLDNDEIGRIIQDIEKENQFKINKKRLTFYGICNRCMQK